MSRSRTKTPVTGMSKAESDKPYKVAEHQRERHQVRQRLHARADDTDLGSRREFGSPNFSPKDGKQYVRGGSIRK